jgi:hypothetical protein
MLLHTFNEANLTFQGFNLGNLCVDSQLRFENLRVKLIVLGVQLNEFVIHGHVSSGCHGVLGSCYRTVCSKNKRLEA